MVKNQIYWLIGILLVIVVIGYFCLSSSDKKEDFSTDNDIEVITPPPNPSPNSPNMNQPYPQLPVVQPSNPQEDVEYL